jgi:hypothetical protein
VKNLPVSKLCQIAMFLLILQLPRHAISQVDSLEQQRAVVAKMHVHQQNGNDGYAAAIYVGSSSQQAYFISANHAVRKGNILTASTVDLRFRSSPTAVLGTVFDSFSVAADLAVISIPLSGLPRQLPQLTVMDVKSDTQIHIIGQPAAGDWSVWAGILQNENATSGDIGHFTTSMDQSLAGGFSGGPVFDSPGYFLGMHTETTNSYGVALKATDILRQLAAWNVPHENLASGNAVIAHPPDSYPVAIVSRHLWIGNKKLGDVTSGTITIRVDDTVNHVHNIRDNFEDESVDLDKGQHQVSFDVDIHARPKSNWNSLIHVKTTCLTSLYVSGPLTVEPFIDFDGRGNVTKCTLGAWQK